MNLGFWGFIITLLILVKSYEDIPSIKVGGVLSSSVFCITWRKLSVPCFEIFGMCSREFGFGEAGGLGYGLTRS